MGEYCGRTSILACLSILVCFSVLKNKTGRESALHSQPVETCRFNQSFLLLKQIKDYKMIEKIKKYLTKARICGILCLSGKTFRR
mgnify:CR=1 FL=1